MPERKLERRSFHAAETRFQGRYARTIIDTLIQAYRPTWKRTALLLALGLLGRFILLGNANLVGLWVDSLCEAPAQCRSLPSFFQEFSSRNFLQILFFATGIGFLFTLAFRAGVTRLSAEAVSRIYDETTLRTSRLPMPFFDANPAGRIMTRFTSDYNNVFRMSGGPLGEMLTLLFDLVVMTLLLAIASPWFLPLWIFQGVLNYGVYRWNLGALRRERRESARKRSPSIAHFAEVAQGAYSIRAFGQEKVFTQRFSRLNDEFLAQRLRSGTVFARFAFSMNVGTAFTFLLTGMASVWLVQQGHVGLGAVGVAFTYLGLSSAILQSVFEWLGQFEEAFTGLERMNEYLRAPLEPGAKLPAAARFATDHTRETTSPVQRWDGMGASVEIEDLVMRYRPDLPPVLNGIQLSIRAGERLAVVGKTGSGKTSLVQALFHLYPLERGRILIAGHEADLGNRKENTIDLASYRAALSYITQESTLFTGTLRENLSAATTSEAEEEMIEALRRVQFLRADARKEEYRHWLDYKVEERGRNISAGERQLVCMARCLLQNAPVVILDEATSAVDPESEAILTRASEEFFRGKTQVLIAHRLSTIRSCDRVLWLQNGNIHRLGRPQEILQEFENSELSL